MVPRCVVVCGVHGRDGERPGAGIILLILLGLLLSEKAGINLQDSGEASRPLQEFIAQFAGGGRGENGDPAKKPATAEPASKKGSAA